MDGKQAVLPGSKSTHDPKLRWQLIIKCSSGVVVDFNIVTVIKDGDNGTK